MPVPREQVADRLRARRLEIEQALLARTRTIADASSSEEIEYRDGYRAALAAAFDFSLAVIEASEEEDPLVPTALLIQARLAARHRVALDAVLRRYVAGSAVIDELILDEFDVQHILPLLRRRASALERLLSKISAEYERERLSRCRSRDARRFERVRRILRGEPLELDDFAYDLGLNHVGIIAHGSGGKEILAALAKRLDCQILLVRPDKETTWAWFGRRQPLHGDNIQTALQVVPASLSLAIGEAAAGLNGWRQTHRQARASVPFALRSSTKRARYADVCLVASAIQDDLLRSSLHTLYLQPLLEEEKGASIYIDTLRAYFEADRNGASAASSLGVSRQTVVNRLRVVEDRLGCPLSACASAVEVAVGMVSLEPGDDSCSSAC